MQWSGFVGRCASVELVWAREDGRGYQERYRVDGCWAEGAGARLCWLMWRFGVHMVVEEWVVSLGHVSVLEDVK